MLHLKEANFKSNQVNYQTFSAWNVYDHGLTCIMVFYWTPSQQAHYDRHHFQVVWKSLQSILYCFWNMSYLCTQTEDHSEDKIIAVDGTKKMMQHTETAPKNELTSALFTWMYTQTKLHNIFQSNWTMKTTENVLHVRMLGWTKPCFEYKNKHVLCFLLIIIKI